MRTSPVPSIETPFARVYGPRTMLIVPVVPETIESPELAVEIACQLNGTSQLLISSKVKRKKKERERREDRERELRFSGSQGRWCQGWK